MAPECLAIEVVYALADEQDVVALAVAPGTTACEAVGLSGLAQRHKQIDPGSMEVGIFGRVVASDAVLRNGDRVEIYRPLGPQAGAPAPSRARTLTMALRYADFRTFGLNRCFPRS